MKKRFRVFRRGWGTYYCEDLVSKKQESLKTRDKEEAYRLVAAKNETHDQPAFSLHLARVYWQAALDLYMSAFGCPRWLFAWILTGGFWRRPQRPSPPSKRPPVIKAKAPTGVLPPVMNPKTSGTHAPADFRQRRDGVEMRALASSIPLAARAGYFFSLSIPLVAPLPFLRGLKLITLLRQWRMK